MQEISKALPLNEADIQELELSKGEERFATVYSGHGSRHRFDGASLTDPESWKSKSEAESDARAWELNAETIGGGARVIDMIRLHRELAAKPERIANLPDF